MFRKISAAACFLGITAAIFNSLYPSEKFGKQLRIIFSLIFILSIVKPLAGKKPEFTETAEAISAGSDYYRSLSEQTDKYFIRSVENNISRNIEASLNGSEIYPEKVETSINISADNSISITEVRVVCGDISVSNKVKKHLSDKFGKDIPVKTVMKEEIQ